MFHAKADVWSGIINLNLMCSVTFLLHVLNEDGVAVSTAKTSVPIAGSSSSSSHSGSGMAGFGVALQTQTMTMARMVQGHYCHPEACATALADG